MHISEILCNFGAQLLNCIKKHSQSSMTYHPDFAKSLQRLPGWTSTPIKRRAVVYGGDFENTAGDIWLLKYDHIEQLFK